MATVMDDSLKLSYDMIFDKNPSWQQEESETIYEQESISAEEMEQRLQKRDDLWQERLKQERAEAKKVGFEKGFAEGEEKARRECLQRVSGLEDMMNQANNNFEQALDDLKPHMAGLVFNLTERVLDIPVEHPELKKRVREEVSQLVEMLNEELHIKVKLCEKDFEMIESLFDDNEHARHISLRIDEELNPGEYLIDTPKECIIKNFKKIIFDFKESVSFTDINELQLEV